MQPELTPIVGLIVTRGCNFVIGTVPAFEPTKRLDASPNDRSVRFVGEAASNDAGRLCRGHWSGLRLDAGRCRGQSQNAEQP